MSYNVHYIVKTMGYTMLTLKERQELSLMLVLKHGMSSFEIFMQYMMNNLELTYDEVEAVSDGEFTAEDAKASEEGYA